MSFKSFATGFAITASLFTTTLLSASESDSLKNVGDTNNQKSPAIPVLNENNGTIKVDQTSFDKEKKAEKKDKHSHKKHGKGHKHGHHGGKGHSHGKGHHDGHSKTFHKMMLLKMLLGETPGHHGFGHGSHGMSSGRRMGFGHHGFGHHGFGHHRSGHHKPSGFSERMHGHKKDKGHRSRGHRSRRDHKSSSNSRHCGKHGFGHHELSSERAAIMGRTLLLYAEIQFTDDQKKQFKELFKTHHENSRKQRGEIFKKIHSLMKAASEGKTEEEIKKAGAELGSAIANSTTKRTNLKTEARKILTAEQLKKIDKTKAANDLSKKQMRKNMKKKFEKIKAKFKKKKEQKKKAAPKEKKA